MVYCGKPSDACHTCRLKRRRCDKKQPSCTQCIRAQSTCPGYRDPTTVLFRDETASVARKIEDKKKQKPNLPRPTLPEVIDPCLEDEHAWRVSRLFIKPDDVALGYFMTSYAPSTPFFYIPSIWESLNNDENVRLALHAVALGNLARESRRPELLRLAHSQYAKALVETNKALGIKQLAVLDTTLLSVLLLAAFEALVFRGRTSPTNWNAHVKGAAALLVLRGKKQLESDVGQRLFNHAGQGIRTSCSQRHVEVPTEFSRLQDHAATVLDPNSPSLRMGRVLDRFAALRANLRGMLATNAIRELLDLDSELAILLEDLKERQPYRVISAAESPVKAYTYGSQMHIYMSQRSQGYWNILRMLRLFVNEWMFCAFDHELRGIIVDLPAPGDPLREEWDKLLEEAIVKGEKIIDEILASVPYGLELLGEPPQASARFLIWPLSGVGASELCPVSAKEFVIHRLKEAGEKHEVEQATLAAKMLEDGDNMEDWLHLAHFS